MTDHAQLWHVEVVDRVAVLSYDNPPMNYLGGAGLHQFGRALDEARHAHPVALIITSAVPDQFITHFSVEDILAGQQKIQERGPLGNQRAQLMLSGSLTCRSRSSRRCEATPWGSVTSSLSRVISVLPSAATSGSGCPRYAWASFQARVGPSGSPGW